MDLISVPQCSVKQTAQVVLDPYHTNTKEVMNSIRFMCFYVCSYIMVWIQHPGEDSDTNLLQAYDEAYVKILFMVFGVCFIQCSFTVIFSRAVCAIVELCCHACHSSEVFYV